MFKSQDTVNYTFKFACNNTIVHYTVSIDNLHDIAYMSPYLCHNLNNVKREIFEIK